MTAAERRRYERRVLGSHERWSLMARLKLGQVVKHDGMPLRKSGDFDLYLMAWLVGEGFRTRHVHPRWLK